MAKVTNPLGGTDARGRIGKRMVFRRGGVVTRYHTPRDPNTIAQQNAREAFRNLVMSYLTQAQADLLYAAINHLHDERYSLLSHVHDHGALTGLADDDHSQYYNQTRGDARYLQDAPNNANLYARRGAAWESFTPGGGGVTDHGALTGLGDDDHTQYFNQTRGDARYSLLTHNHNSLYVSALQILFAGGQNAAVPASSTNYLNPVHLGILTAAGRNIVMSRACTLKNLYFITNTAQPGSGSFVITVQKNNAASALTVTIAAGAGANTFSDITHTVTFAAGDTCCIEMKNNATAASALVANSAIEMVF